MSVIIGYVGYSGSGKTYHMTETALSLMAQGIPCASRHEIVGALPLLEDREIIYLHGYHVFLDEWHQDHDASQWRKLSPLVKHIVTQARKYGITLHWSAQCWEYMDSYIRRNTEDVWEHRAIMPDKLSGRSRIGLHAAVRMHGSELELRHVNPPILARKRFRIRRAVYEKYDSFKKILLTSEQLSDEEIQTIADPTNRPNVAKIEHVGCKTFREVLLSPDELYQPPDDDVQT